MPSFSITHSLSFFLSSKYAHTSHPKKLPVSHSLPIQCSFSLHFCSSYYLSNPQLQLKLMEGNLFIPLFQSMSYNRWNIWKRKKCSSCSDFCGPSENGIGAQALQCWGLSIIGIFNIWTVSKYSVKILKADDQYNTSPKSKACFSRYKFHKNTKNVGNIWTVCNWVICTIKILVTQTVMKWCIQSLIQVLPKEATLCLGRKKATEHAKFWWTD